MADSLNFNDFGSMQTKLSGYVSSISKYSVDEDSKGGHIWLERPNNDENPNWLGNQIIKVAMPFEMFQFCHDSVLSGVMSFPGVFEIEANVVMGGGNRPAFRALTIKQIARARIVIESLTPSGSAGDSKTPNSKPDTKS